MNKIAKRLLDLPQFTTEVMEYNDEKIECCIEIADNGDGLVNLLIHIPMDYNDFVQLTELDATDLIQEIDAEILEPLGISIFDLDQPHYWVEYDNVNNNTIFTYYKQK